MANNNFVIDTGLQVGPLYIFAANGDIRTSGNIVYTASGPDNILTTPGSAQGFANSTSLSYPGSQGAAADYSVTQVTIDGVVTTETETGPTNVTPTLDAFGIVTSTVTAKVDIYDCMEPVGYVESADLGALP